MWNHRNYHDPGPKKWENYVKVGRNKCWCARELEWETVKVLLCQEDEPREKDVGPFEEMDGQSVLEVWVDGDLRWTKSGLVSSGCTDPAKLVMPSNAPTT